MIQVQNLCKTFTLHHQGGARIAALTGINLTVEGGDCVVLHGPSGTGKSTLMRSLYANYKPQSGSVLIRHKGAWVDMVTAPPYVVIEVRRFTIGYVSQFLRVIPRVSTLDIVSEPLRAQGVDQTTAERRAKDLLASLNIPEALWSLAPGTFSGGEQQRVNIAHSFVADYPVLLLDEPTAALDAENRRIVVDLINRAKQRGAAIVGIFHDADARDAVGTRLFEMRHAETGDTAA
ncbi:MAG: phosphonate C-P lyase system protein PhnL [Magnetospiraceae bacterium]